jgi:hypothetical protein
MSNRSGRLLLAMGALALGLGATIPLDSAEAALVCRRDKDGHRRCRAEQTAPSPVTAPAPGVSPSNTVPRQEGLPNSGPRPAPCRKGAPGCS